MVETFNELIDSELAPTKYYDKFPLFLKETEIFSALFAWD